MSKNSMFVLLFTIIGTVFGAIMDVVFVLTPPWWLVAYVGASGGFTISLWIVAIVATREFKRQEKHVVQHNESRVRYPWKDVPNKGRSSLG